MEINTNGYPWYWRQNVSIDVKDVTSLTMLEVKHVKTLSIDVVIF